MKKEIMSIVKLFTCMTYSLDSNTFRLFKCMHLTKCFYTDVAL